MVARFALCTLFATLFAAESTDGALRRRLQFGAAEGGMIRLTSTHDLGFDPLPQCPEVLPSRILHRQVYRNYSAGVGCPKRFRFHEKDASGKCPVASRLQVYPADWIEVPYSIEHGKQSETAPPPLMLRPLDENSLQKSRKTVGNVYRFRNLLCKLWAGKPVRVLVLGGSNTKDAYLPMEEPPWPTVLEEWLNERFPIIGNSSDGEARHVVVNRGSSGAGSCVNAPRLPMLMNKDSPFDLVLTEFGINDAQFAEQGTATTGFYAAPPYGDHYKQIAKCTEILIRNILNADPNTALVFLELPSWSLRFSNAGEVHQTFCNFYEIPYLSLKDAIWPAMRSNTGLFKNMTEQQIHDVYWPVDFSHVSVWGHHAIVDLIANMIQTESSPHRLVVDEQPALLPKDWKPEERVFFGQKPPALPYGSNVLSGPVEELEKESKYAYIATSQTALESKENFLDVDLRGKGYGTKEFAPLSNTSCWDFWDDTIVKHKPGWICDQPEGGEKITFFIPLETSEKGYNLKVGFLRSYEKMGRFKVEGHDLATDLKESKEFDGIWLKKISVYNEEFVFKSTGNATLTIETITSDKSEARKEGNKIKLLAVLAYGA